jgi:hypothetical protein
VTVGSYFGQDVTGIVERLLGEQMADGGWNCEQENGSTRGSFHTTINVLEGFLEHERATGRSAEVNAALERGQEYLLERRMLRVAEAIDLVRSKRDAQGRLPLENPHESELVGARVRDLELDTDEREGRPSHWNTLRAMRVLDWYERGR